MKSELGVMLPGGKTGILLLHDLGGSAAELQKAASAFARAGFTVSCPQMTSLNADIGFGRASAGMLVSEAEQALAQLRSRCDSIVAIGMAYGGMLALELARHNAAAVQAAVLIEPRAWLPSLPFKMPTALLGKVNQTWLASALLLGGRAAGGARQTLASVFGRETTSPNTHSVAPGLLDIGNLLDSVHAGLPAIRQPTLLVHSQLQTRKGNDDAFLFQRRLGGRVESVMLDGAGAASVEHDRDVDRLVDRVGRFVSTVIEEIATRRDNEQRRQKMAASRNNAA